MYYTHWLKLNPKSCWEKLKLCQGWLLQYRGQKSGDSAWLVWCNCQSCPEVLRVWSSGAVHWGGIPLAGFVFPDRGWLHLNQFSKFLLLSMERTRCSSGVLHWIVEVVSGFLSSSQASPSFLWHPDSCCGMRWTAHKESLFLLPDWCGVYTSPVHIPPPPPGVCDCLHIL